MIDLSQDTEALAQRLAAAQSLSVAEAVRRALETQARLAGIEPALTRRRMTVERMMELGGEISALPVIDSRATSEIINDVNSP